MAINILVITSLYPNAEQYRHGIFVETRLRHLINSGEVNAEVIAPVPWFPFKSKYFGSYSKYSRIPSSEDRNGIRIYHPRYLVLPKIGMYFTPFLMALSLIFAVFKIRKSGFKYDLIDGHYYYPDGVAISLLSLLLNKPFILTARGTDINLIPEFWLPRRLILWAANKATASITVCQALKDKMIEIGADSKKIHVFRNGVDLGLFRPLERSTCKSKHGVKRSTLLSVGHLIERKGHDLVIEALKELPECDLIIAGDGELERDLKLLVSQYGLDDRVRFVGAVTQDKLAEIYNAVDILVLASSREGWANVLLEAMACGTPVVATSIWGTPEVVKKPEAGVLAENRTAKSIADGVRELLNSYPDRGDTRKYAELFSWDATVKGILDLFNDIKKFSVKHSD
ncbi:MAG: glycosyltransferase family 4 protein [Sedimenticola sp.]